MYEGSTKKALVHHLKKHNKVDKRRSFKEVKEYVEKEIIPISLLNEVELDEMREMKSFYWKIFKYYGELLNLDISRFNEYSVEKTIEDNKKQKTTVVNNYYEAIKSKKKKVKEPTFDEMVDTYIKHLLKKKKVSKGTIEDYSPSYHIVNEAFPNKKLSELSTKDLELLEDLISFLPAYRNGKKLTRDLDIYGQVEFMKKVLEDRANNILKKEHEDFKVIGEGRQNTNFKQVSNFIDFCSKKYNFESPLNGIVLQRYRIKSDSSTERLHLTADEISKVFNEFDYLNEKLIRTLKNDPLKVYGIFLIMFLGMRPRESGQLMITDLQKTKDSKDNMIYYLNVSKENTSGDDSLDDIKREKTDNARRKLPLTDVFIKDLKFLEFVKHRKKEGHKFIFVDEKNNESIEDTIRNTTRRCGDHFNKSIKKLDIKDIEKKSFLFI